MDSVVSVEGTDVRLYSVREAADYCGGPDGSVSKDTINRWRKHGYLRYLKVSPRAFLYTKEMLDECLGLKGYSNRIKYNEGE